MAGYVEWDDAYGKQGRLWGGVTFPLLPLPPHSRILELGCGNGKLTAALSEKTDNLIALDFSVQACRLARKQLASGDGRTDLLIADARAIPLAADSVDAVVAHHIAGHLLLQDRIILMDESIRVLKKGGRFLLGDFSIEDFRCGIGREVEGKTYRRGNGIITHYFSEEEVRSLTPLLTPDKIMTHRWSLKVRGKNHTRAEIIGCFTRS